MKKRLFIGSASESLDVAYAAQEALDRALEVTVWTQGLFQPSRTTMESLAEQPSKFDAALFVFTPDDAAILRGQPKRVVRDNVIFELGLFVGALGRMNTFILLPRDVPDLHLPSDLAGVTPLDYDHHRQDGNLVAAVGPACNKIKKALITGYGSIISEGNNRNEHRWRIFRKKLELLQLDGNVHSRFFYDATADRWTHTNDEDTLSIRGQYIEPER